LDAVTEKVGELVETIRHTEEYRRYKKLTAEIEKDVELSRRLNEFRKENFDMQVAGRDLYDAVDGLREKYADLFKNPLANDMIETENSVCRLIRSVYMEITRAISVDPPRS
jgi:cell fate (sporulation/competence/biofilm development) regulator YlbF (YheA/YmcA/DUF963 family)